MKMLFFLTSLFISSKLCAIEETLPPENSQVQSSDPAKTTSSINFLVLRINDDFKLIKKNHTLSVMRGDVIKLTDIIGTIANKSRLTVNFVGYKNHNPKNLEHDFGFSINTHTDLIASFAQSDEKNLFEIYVKEGDTKIAFFYVKVREPKFSYLIIEKSSGEKKALYAQDELTVSKKDYLRVLDVKTNVSQNDGVKLRVRLIAGSRHALPNIFIKELRLKTPESGEALPKRPDQDQPLAKLMFEIVKQGTVFGQIPVTVVQ